MPPLMPQNDEEFTSYRPPGVIQERKWKPGVQLPALSIAEILVKVRVRCRHSELLTRDEVTCTTPSSLQDQHGHRTTHSPPDPLPSAAAAD